MSMTGTSETAIKATAAVRTPPYVSYKSFETLLDELKTNGVPPQIDRSVLSRFSGGLGGQLIMALKSLGLANAQSEPTPALKEMVDAYGTPAYKDALRRALEHGFPFLADLDLTTATPSMFADAFVKNTSAKEDVLRKCRTFYLNAARDADIELGQRLATGSVPKTARGTSGNGRRRRTRTASRPQSTAQAEREPDHTAGRKLEYQLVDLLKRDDMTDEYREAVFKLLTYLSTSEAA